MVQLPSFCILHLSWDVFLGPVLSVMKWRLVSPQKKKEEKKKKQAHGRKNTTLCPPPSCSFSLSLPQHVIQTCVSDHAHAHTHMRAHSCGCCTLHLTHTVQTEDFMVFLKLENKEVHRNRKSPCYHLCSQMLLAWKRNH